MIVLRSVIGDELRRERLDQVGPCEKSLSQARVSLGYLVKLSVAEGSVQRIVCRDLGAPGCSSFLGAAIGEFKVAMREAHETKQSVTSAA